MIISGILQFQLSKTIVAFAEIIQFLCLFALISIPNYPEILNKLYHVKSYFNLYLFSLTSNIILDCEQLQRDEHIDANFQQHPAIRNINLLCNSFSFILTITIVLFLYILCSLVYLKLSKKFKKSNEWNGFLQLFNVAIIVISVTSFTQITFVIII